MPGVPGKDAHAPPAVVVEGIARRFGPRWALRGVSLRVEPGEVVALAGHNGSGKTTLLRVIATSLRPTLGAGRVYGHDLQRQSGRVRELVGALGHAPGLYGDLTAAENLIFAAKMAGFAANRHGTLAALEAVGLGREADERVRAFSAGMQRRLALARLLMRRPHLALLDEPYASFDADGVERVNRFLAELKAAGHAAILAAHDLDRAASVVDRVVRLAGGRNADPDPAAAGMEGERNAGLDGAAPRPVGGGVRG